MRSPNNCQTLHCVSDGSLCSKRLGVANSQRHSFIKWQAPQSVPPNEYGDEIMDPLDHQVDALNQMQSLKAVWGFVVNVRLDIASRWTLPYYMAFETSWSLNFGEQWTTTESIIPNWLHMPIHYTNSGWNGVILNASIKLHICMDPTNSCSHRWYILPTESWKIFETKRFTGTEIDRIHVTFFISTGTKICEQEYWLVCRQNLRILPVGSCALRNEEVRHYPMWSLDIIDEKGDQVWSHPRDLHHIVTHETLGLYNRSRYVLLGIKEELADGTSYSLPYLVTREAKCIDQRNRELWQSLMDVDWWPGT